MHYYFNRKSLLLGLAVVLVGQSVPVQAFFSDNQVRAMHVLMPLGAVTAWVGGSALVGLVAKVMFRGITGCSAQTASRVGRGVAVLAASMPFVGLALNKNEIITVIYENNQRIKTLEQERKENKNPNLGPKRTVKKYPFSIPEPVTVS